MPFLWKANGLGLPVKVGCVSSRGGEDSGLDNCLWAYKQYKKKPAKKWVKRTSNVELDMSWHAKSLRNKNLCCSLAALYGCIATNTKESLTVTISKVSLLDCPWTEVLGPGTQQQLNMMQNKYETPVKLRYKKCLWRNGLHKWIQLILHKY